MGLPAAARMEHTAPQRNATQQRSARRNATCSSATERHTQLGKQAGKAAHTAPRSLTLPRLVTDVMLVQECVACLAGANANVDAYAKRPSSSPASVALASVCSGELVEAQQRGHRKKDRGLEHLTDSGSEI
ncbi:hypothetical protein ACHAPS_008814 [Verticillium nonalfalfae]